MRFFLLLFFIGCQDFNSNTFDETKFGVSNLTGGEKFKTAYPIIQNKCANCHTHSEWSGFTTEAKWEEEDLVVPGNPDNSKFITRILNTGRNESDMPQGGSPLPDEEYEILVDWVENFEQ